MTEPTATLSETLEAWSEFADMWEIDPACAAGYIAAYIPEIKAAILTAIQAEDEDQT